MAITRTPMVDDDGTGTTGTVINNAWKQQFYDQIDAFVASIQPSGIMTWTPAWTSSGTAPVLGSGTITGNYARTGRVVVFNIRLGFGSTTTYGTGTYYLTYPPVLPVSTFPVTTAYGVKQGVGFYLFNGILSTGTTFSLYNTTGMSGGAVGGSAGGWGFGAPFTPASGDIIEVAGVYLTTAA